MTARKTETKHTSTIRPNMEKITKTLKNIKNVKKQAYETQNRCKCIGLQ